MCDIFVCHCRSLGKSLERNRNMGNCCQQQMEATEQPMQTWKLHIIIIDWKKKKKHLPFGILATAIGSLLYLDCDSVSHDVGANQISVFPDWLVMCDVWGLLTVARRRIWHQNPCSDSCTRHVRIWHTLELATHWSWLHPGAGYTLELVPCVADVCQLLLESTIHLSMPVFNWKLSTVLGLFMFESPIDLESAFSVCLYTYS